MTTISLTGDALYAVQFKRGKVLERAAGPKAAEAVRNFINSALARENPLYRLPEALRATIDAACASADAPTLQKKIKAAFANFYGNLSPVLSAKGAPSTKDNSFVGAGAGVVKSAKYAVEAPEYHSVVGILTTYFEMVEAAQKNPDASQTATAGSMKMFIHTLINEEGHQKIFSECAATLPKECRQIHRALRNLFEAAHVLSLKNEPDQLKTSIDHTISKFSTQERLLFLYKLANLALLQAGDSLPQELLAVVKKALRAPGKSVDMKTIESFFAISKEATKAKAQIATSQQQKHASKAEPAKVEAIKVELPKAAQSSLLQQITTVQKESSKIEKPVDVATGAGSVEHTHSLQKPKDDFEELEGFQLDPAEPEVVAESKKSASKPQKPLFEEPRMLLGYLLKLAERQNPVEQILNYFERIKSVKYYNDIFLEIFEWCKVNGPKNLKEAILHAFLVHFGPVVSRNPISPT